MLDIKDRSSFGVYLPNIADAPVLCSEWEDSQKGSG